MGVSLSAITLTNQAVMGLSPKDIPQGISLNNMIRQLGGSFGIAIMNTIISQRAAIHRNDLIQNYRQGNLPFDERYNAMLQGVSSKLAVTSNASKQVYSLMEFTINQQTYLLTYLDAFRFSMLFIALSFPIIFFLKTKKIDAATAKAVAEAAH
jgi:DHA2 family multidrug resistance protein